MDWVTLDNWKVKAESDELTYKEAADHHGMLLYLIQFCSFHKLPNDFIPRLTAIDIALYRKMQRTPKSERS